MTDVRLSENQFKILKAIVKNSSHTQRSLSAEVNLSIGTVNAVYRSLVEKNCCKDYKITEKGLKRLQPYRVDNAVIMAAGFASRCAPLSYEMPKGLFTVKGEVLIERQIRQLQESGISTIYLVVGYMKELFFYLEEKFNIKIIVNKDYYRRNNTSSIYAAREHFGNTYVCSSDNYFLINPFEPYVYDSYFAVQYSREFIDEWCATLGARDKIVKYEVGGEDALYQVGEFYWSREFSERFIDLLCKEYDEPETAEMLLDKFYAHHIDQLPAGIKQYEDGSILEFDTINEIREFDSAFVNNTNSKILTNICVALDCAEVDIKGIRQIKRGNTNILFEFTCKGEHFVYRHPGAGTSRIINRQHEAYAQEKADELGIDGTTIAIVPDEGWKISRFVEDCYEFSYREKNDAERAMKLARKLHDAKIPCEWPFDMIENIKNYKRLIEESNYCSDIEFGEIESDIVKLYDLLEADGFEKVLCHNDICDSNIIPTKDDIRFIDWEFAGLADPMSDVSSFIVGGEHSLDEVSDIIKMYFDGAPTPLQMRHALGYVALSGFHWMMWGIWKQSTGHDVGDLLYGFYRYARDYRKVALGMYSNQQTNKKD